MDNFIGTFVIIIFFCLIIVLPIFLGYIRYRPHQLRNKRRGKNSKGVLFRLIAKAIDFWIIYIAVFGLLAFILAMTSPSTLRFILDINDRTFGVMYIVFCFSVDSLFMAIIGTTFGKWTLGIKVKRVNGQKIGLRTAFKRNVYIIIMCFGGFIPIVSNFLAANSYFYYKAMGQASWDIGAKTRVTRSTPSFTGLLGLGVIAGIVYFYYPYIPE